MNLRRMTQLWDTLVMFDKGEWVASARAHRGAPTQFDIKEWCNDVLVNDNYQVIPPPDVVTGCAIGIASHTATFIAQGFTYHPIQRRPKYKTSTGYNAVANFFNIPYAQAIALFHPSSYVLPEQNHVAFVIIKVRRAIDAEAAKWHRSSVLTRWFHEWFEK